MVKINIIALLAGLAPATGFAGTAYDCGFMVMGEDAPVRATLTEKETEWQFVVENGATTHFVIVPGSENRNAFHLVSTDFDPDADAVAMLSVSAAGDARLSFHGFFPNFDGNTMNGSCHRKEQ